MTEGSEIDKKKWGRRAGTPEISSRSKDPTTTPKVQPLKSYPATLLCKCLSDLLFILHRCEQQKPLLAALKGDKKELLLNQRAMFILACK